MSEPAQVLQDIFTVIEGGSQIGTSAEIIQFPSDNGQTVYTAVQKTFQGSNGTGLNYWVAAVAQGATAISAGALMITLSIPEFMALAVPCLGIAVGTAWYNLDPEGWTNLANKLFDAGQTVKEKVVAFMVENGTIGLQEESINILKDELLRLGAFEHGAQYPAYEPAPEEGIAVETNISLREMINYAISKIPNSVVIDSIAQNQIANILLQYNDWASILSFTKHAGYNVPSYGYIAQINPVTEVMKSARVTPSHVISWGIQLKADGLTHIIEVSISESPSYIGDVVEYFVGNASSGNHVVASSLNGTIINNDNLQDFAKYPNEYEDIDETYPLWIPWEFPRIPGWTIDKVFPAQYPELLPIREVPYQDPAQNPQGDTDEEAEKGVNTLIDTRHDPQVESEQEKKKEEDIDTGDEEEEIPSDPETENPNPIDPDPPVPPSPIIVPSNLPNTVGSSKMFTVYNPSQLELNSLGAYLWDMDLIDMLRRIWQNPLDGIISLSQVFCTPVTGSPHNIILGFLDTGVSANIVASQFKEIDCGTITIAEQKNNATDYNPYTAMELYLPFIGITEIDTNEFMGGSISVKYKVDVYTGTCLAEVKMTRTKDVPNGAVVYTFNGNCSQQLPLTSGDSRELIATLATAAGVGIGIATGGASIGIAGVMAGGAGAIRREMLHVSHSGNLSANAGMLGHKKPYVIISRQNPYNANGYNRLYGYPTNKTVFLSNCSGYTRVKAGRYKGLATQNEKDEIMEFLMDGVIM